MDMTDADIIPEGAGSLPGPAASGPAAPLGQVTAAFVNTPGEAVHPDTTWRPLGGELAAGRPWRGDSGQADALSPHQFPGDSDDESTASPGFDFHGQMSATRAALRGGV